MKYETPKLRYTNDRILGEIGFSHLLIATALMSVLIGVCAMFVFGVRNGSAIWMALQVSTIGTAAGVYLSKLRGSVGDFEHSTWEAQHDLEFSPLVKRLYYSPTLEYWVLGWGTLAARLWVVLSSAIAASLLGNIPFLWALGLAVAIQVSVKFHFILFVVAGVSLFPLPALPMVGTVGVPDGMLANVFMLLLPPLMGLFQKVRYKRHSGEGVPTDERKLAAGSGFYISHEVIGGLLSEALEYGGGYERARDGIRLATVEEQTPAVVSEGWKPAVGDLHRGQTVDTAELVTALREAANADSLRNDAQQEAA